MRFAMPRAVFARQTSTPTPAAAPEPASTEPGAAPSSETAVGPPAGGSVASDLAPPPTPAPTPSSWTIPTVSTTRTSPPGSPGAGSGQLLPDSTTVLLNTNAHTTSFALWSTETSNSYSGDPNHDYGHSSGSRRNVVLIAVVSVLVPLCLIAAVLAVLTRRRRIRKRKIDHVINKDFRSSSPDDDIFPVHFKSDSAAAAAEASADSPLARGEKLQMLQIRTHDLGSSDRLLPRSNRDSTGSTSTAELTPTQPTSVLGSEPTPATAVERQFQASLAARARKMGIQPHQLLMLLTTSLDNQAGMSDVASTSDASSDRAFSVVSSSDRAFSLASVPPPYDHFALGAAVRRSQDVKQ